MTAPQTPPPCPPWCRLYHPEATGEQSVISHIGPTFAKHPTTGTNAVTIVSCWTKWGGDRGPQIMVERPEGIGALHLDAEQARTLADVIAAFNRRSPLAAALRQAAGELDRITGGA